MSTNLNADSFIESMDTSVTSNTAGAPLTAINGLMRRVFGTRLQDGNVAGGAARWDVGTQLTNLPDLDADGHMPRSVLPEGDDNQFGVLRFATQSEVQSELLDVAMTPADLTAFNSDVAQAGLVRKASSAEVNAGSNVDRFVTAANVHEVFGEPPDIVDVGASVSMTNVQTGIPFALGHDMDNYSCMIIHCRLTQVGLLGNRIFILDPAWLGTSFSTGFTITRWRVRYIPPPPSNPEQDPSIPQPVNYFGNLVAWRGGDQQLRLAAITAASNPRQLSVFSIDLIELVH